VVNGELVEPPGEREGSLEGSDDCKAGFLVGAVGGGADQVRERKLLFFEFDPELVVATLVLGRVQDLAIRVAGSKDAKVAGPGALGRRHEEDGFAVLLFQEVYAPKSSLIGFPRPSRVT
jgi:hypothetical protein